jgi:hypothetical protein
VLDVAGVSWWDSPYAYEGTLAVVQGDADPELELVVRAQLRDAHTGAILRTLSLPSGAEAYASGDVDGDGPDDLVFWTASGVHAYDVVDDAPRWLVASPMLLQPLPPILFDLDDDGLDEVLVSSPALVVDGVTGAVLREPSICGRLVGVHQFGRPWLGCHYHGLLASGPEVRETPGLGRVDQLEAIDLDGDGQRELVALGTRAHVFDPDGRRLTTNHHGHTWWLEFLRRLADRAVSSMCVRASCRCAGARDTAWRADRRSSGRRPRSQTPSCSMRTRTASWTSSSREGASVVSTCRPAWRRSGRWGGHRSVS